MKRFIVAALLAALLPLSGCELDEPTLGGTILSVVETERGDGPAKDSPKQYDNLLWPEIAWKVAVRLDDGHEVTVIHNGSRRYAPGERVRLLVGEDGELLL